MVNTSPEAGADDIEEQLRPYHSNGCHSGQAWVKGMTKPFPCDCGLTNLLETERERVLDMVEAGLEKKDFKMAVRAGSEMWGAQIDAHNQAIDEFREVIGRLRNA